MKEGLYEQVINRKIKNEIEEAEKNDYKIDRKNIEEAEAPQILSKYISDVVKKGLNQVNTRNFASQINIANKIVALIEESTGDEEYKSYKLNEENTAEQLLSVLNKKNNSLKETKLVRPETSVAFSSLFTGGAYEPNMMGELKKEIRSADRIDMLVSFIKWSGLRLILDELKEFTARGGKLRVITTSYMGATDVRAVEELEELENTEVKISYDTKRTRLHAKAYIFYRNTGFTTAYVGSSNLSNAAISSGLEWNMKVTKKELPEILDKINMTFESYWESCEFSEYKKEDALKLQRALNAEKYQDNSSINDDYGFDVYPYPYQQEILDKLKAEREIHNRFKNLVVAATGTGKTVISAFDYRNFRRENKGKPCRLLFVAHREEIVKQSMNTFRGILHDGNFGELFVGNYKPDKLDYVFASIQSVNSAKLTEVTDPSYYDFIIVDEFHHAAADSYQNVLAYYKPKILLGLTATPERMDGKSILEYFDNRIAAEIRLPEAVNRKLLCPFQYFGVADTVDYSELKWSRGGYDKTELSNVLTGNDARVHLIINKLRQYVSDVNEVIGIGFCVSKAHAAYMAEKFNEAGIPSMALTSDSSRVERENAKNMLVSGKIKFIFTVDLYNEGVDIPAVNTVLFLRPTESLTVFLQQLGRGLRLYEGKDCLTVLDFVGQSNKKYNFEQKFAALLTKSGKGVKDEIENEFTNLPKGCYIELEKQASQYILDNIKEAVKGKNSIVSKMKTFEEDTGLELNLSNFLKNYNIDPELIYKTKFSFARLMVIAGCMDDFKEETEKDVTAALKRLCFLDSRRLIDFAVKLFNNPLKEECYSEAEIKMINMLQFTIWQKSFEDCGFSDRLEGFRKIASDIHMKNEITELLIYNYEKIDFVDEESDLGFVCPLDLHCTYTRDQILTALDFLKPNTVREGTKYLEDKKTDIHFVTLNKTEKDYSPSTMYQDYSINEILFHWQSQSTTSDESRTGKRYRNHKEEGVNELIFVREHKKTEYGEAAPYTYLGKADFVKYEGSKPMNIVWKLEKPIPAKYLKKTSKAV